jgi:glycosyltransferase involved in cell wall biosynthesis
MVRNPIYFDPTYYERMQSRQYRAELQARRWLCLMSARNSDAVVFPTQAMLDMTARYLGGPRPGWAVVPEGIDHASFPAAPSRASTGRPVRILNVSLYSDQKNITVLLKAQEQLEQEEPGTYRLTLTTGLLSRRLDRDDTPSAPGDHQLLSRLIAQGVAEDIGPLRRELVPPLYRECDVFVFPSYTESFGHPLVEAMASGIPIIAADTPVNREMCQDAACYVPPFAVEEYARQIRRVSGDAALRSRLVDAGLRRAREFSWERNVRGTLRACGLDV